MEVTKSKTHISWGEIDELIDIICTQISNYTTIPVAGSIFGMPRGGLIPAVIMSHKLNIPLIVDENLITEKTLIVDDICDSGETFTKMSQKYPKNYSACLHLKPHTSNFIPDFWAESWDSDDWIVYPWERDDSETIQDYLK